MGNRDRQKNSGAGSVATVLWSVVAALQQLLHGIAAAVAIQHATASGTGNGRALQQVTTPTNQWWQQPQQQC